MGEKGEREGSKLTARDVMCCCVCGINLQRHGVLSLICDTRKSQRCE